MFTPRFAKPLAGNPYYNTAANGGYSRAVRGNPADAGCDVLANCVGYAVGRFHEIAGRKEMDLIDPVNAENLFDNAKKHGLCTGSTPQLGALIVWQKGATLSGGDGAGHVGVVEQVGADGTIVTSESGWGAQKPFWTAVRKPPYAYGKGYRLLGFVYQPAGTQQTGTEPLRTLKKGMAGSDVLWMQHRLYLAGCLRENETDGHFGMITLGALLAFQLTRGLRVDGVCGRETKAALKKPAAPGK